MSPQASGGILVGYIVGAFLTALANQDAPHGAKLAATVALWPIYLIVLIVRGVRQW